MKDCRQSLLWLWVCGLLIFIQPLAARANASGNAQRTSPATEATEQNVPRKKLVFSAGEWPPYLGAALPQQGMAAQLIRDIFADAGYQVTFDFLPWPRAYRETLQGQYAATAVWMYATERAADFYYSSAVLEEEFVLFYLKNKPLLFHSIADLVGLELGGGFGYSYGPAFDAAIAGGQLKMTRVSHTAQNFQRLLKGRIRAFPEEKQVGYHTLRTELPESQHLITHAQTVLLRNQSFVLFPKSHPDSQHLLDIFQQGLNRYIMTGRYPRYFTTEPAESAITPTKLDAITAQPE
jgi:polar amino acid transport system substrate-binding protein